MRIVENAERTGFDLGAGDGRDHSRRQLSLAQAAFGDEIGICEGVDGSVNNALPPSRRKLWGLLTVGHLSLNQRVALLRQVARACWIHGSVVCRCVASAQKRLSHSRESIKVGGSLEAAWPFFLLFLLLVPVALQI